MKYPETVEDFKAFVADFQASAKYRAPILFAIAALAIVVNHIWADITQSAIGLLIVASGFPAYYFWARRSPR